MSGVEDYQALFEALFDVPVEILDWDSSLVDTDRLVRAVARPFHGAFSYLDGREPFLGRDLRGLR